MRDEDRLKRLQDLFNQLLMEAKELMGERIDNRRGVEAIEAATTLYYQIKRLRADLRIRTIALFLVN